MADLTTLQTWLTAAETARHALRTGSLEVQVEHTGGGIRVAYNKTNAGELDAYIADLRAQIVALGGTLTGTGLRRRPLIVDL